MSFTPRLRQALRWIPMLSGFALVAVSFLVAADVIMRRLFNVSATGSGEIAGYVLAIISTWGFAYAAADKAHIRIDSLIQFLPMRLRALSGLVAQASLLGFGLFLSYHAWGVVAFSLEHASKSQTPLQVPLAIPQSIWLAGILVFTLTTLFIVVAGARCAARRDWQTLAEIGGDGGREELPLESSNGGKSST